MRAGFPLLVTVLAVLSAAAVYKTIAASSGNSNAGVPKEIFQLYAQWKQANGKLYATPAENDHRLQVFFSQKQFIDKANTDYAEAWAAKHKMPLKKFVFSLNGFADLTSEEFRVKYTSLRVSEPKEDSKVAYVDRQTAPTPLRQIYPTQFNYIPRNSGSYPASWAFAFIESYEKHYFQQTGTRLSFSQQELIDCYYSWTFQQICTGVNNAGISTAATYPYIAAKQSCQSDAKNRVPAAKMLYYEQGSAEMSFIRRLTDRGYQPWTAVYAAGKFRYIGPQSEFVDASLSGECTRSNDSSITIYTGGKDATFQIMNFWGTLWGDNGLKYILPCTSTSIWGTGSSTKWLEPL